MSDPTARALTLLSLLQTHRHWTGPELSDRLGVSARTVRRDVDRLRELGYPVEAVAGVDGGYQLAAGAHLPPLLVDDDEAVALAVGLRAAAGAAVEGIEETTLRVMAKLEQILPNHVRRRVDAINSNVESLRWTPSTTVPPSSLGVLAQACRDHEEVRFEYTRRDGESTNRLVQPHQLVSVGQRWYLVAWDTRREDWRTFRIDRMEALSLAGVRFETRELPTETAADFVAAGLSSIPQPFEAVLRISATQDELETVPHWFGAEITALVQDEHRVVLTSETSEWLAAMISMLATSLELVVDSAPEATLQQLSNAARRLPEIPN